MVDPTAVATNIVSQLIVQAVIKRWKRLDERKIEQIVEAYLQKHQLLLQPVIIEKQVIVILTREGKLQTDGTLKLPHPPNNMQGIYNIVSVSSGKALDVKDEGRENGVAIQQWTLYGGFNQQWRLIPVSEQSTLYVIHSQQSGLVLDVKDWSDTDGAEIQQWHYEKQANQHWQLIPIPHTNDVYAIISQHTQKALDVKDRKQEDGTPIQQWYCHGDTNQQWQLIRVI